MVCLTAQALKRFPPFHEHPGNKREVLPDKCFDEYVRAPQRLGREIRQALQSEVRGGIPRGTIRRMCLMSRPTIPGGVNNREQDLVERQREDGKVLSASTDLD